ncbi:glycosyltransferase family 2 protein [Aquirufa nivalisilvae]|uniref:glycosyltransferase family 2 protein n=1 Tax=Aquirufa nivalisilvae TaxID=2516557 RepID=UPI0022A9EA45|nr:glycosyltransferase family 2 protein [Aquirufa nivalisilvae]MCZ2482949.1 glycosyltransferase family 2 protein [Aquirufa nivalisilvae]
MTTPKTNKSLDLVHPCYNPHPGWAEDLIRHYTLFMSRIPTDVVVHMYVVDDGSKHGVHSEDIDQLQQAIPHFTFIPLSQNLGKGGALRHAIRQSQGDLVIYTDADYPYKMENAWEMYQRLAVGNADVVVGVRDEQYYDQLPFRRKIFSLSLKLMNYLFFPGLKVKDTQSGLKGFNAKGKALFLKTTISAFLFDMEFLVLVSKQKDIQMEWIYVQVREGIHFSTMKPRTILTELFNFASILIRGFFSK